MPLIIFDCDGVLVDSETLENEIGAHCLTQAGWPMTGAQARERFIGLTTQAVMGLAQAHLGHALPQNWLSDFHAISHARLKNEITAIEGVSTAIDAIEAMGFTTAVASSGEHDKMKITLGRTGLYERFKGRIFSAQDVLHGKPAPDVYLLAAKTLGYAPVAAGMYTFGYSAQIDPALLAEVSVNEIFFNMSELPDRLTQAVERKAKTSN